MRLVTNFVIKKFIKLITHRGGNGSSLLDLIYFVRLFTNFVNRTLLSQYQKIDNHFSSLVITLSNSFTLFIILLFIFHLVIGF